MMSSALHLSLGPQKTPTPTAFRNPTGLLDELGFFARVLLFIPHYGIFRFPERVDSHRKRRNVKGWCMRRCCERQVNLLVLELLKFITVCSKRIWCFTAFPLPLQGGPALCVIPWGKSNRLNGIHLVVLRKMRQSSFRTIGMALAEA